MTASEERPPNLGFSVRYIVDDVDAAVPFYTERLGFKVEVQTGPIGHNVIAILRRGELRLLLTHPDSAILATPEESKPAPGGWNRVVLQVDDLEAETQRLHEAGVNFRHGTATGPGGSQVVIEDTSGNPIELFQWSGLRMIPPENGD